MRKLPGLSDILTRKDTLATIQSPLPPILRTGSTRYNFNLVPSLEI